MLAGAQRFWRFDQVWDKPEVVAKLRVLYNGSLRLTDDQTGRLVTALGEADLWEETILVFTTDHGEMPGDHGLVTKGPNHYLDWEGEVHGLFTKTRWAFAGKSQVTIPDLFVDLLGVVSRVSWSLWVYLARFRIGSRVSMLHSTTFPQGVTQTCDQATRSSAAGMGRPERTHRSHDR